MKFSRVSSNIIVNIKKSVKVSVFKTSQYQSPSSNAYGKKSLTI